MKINLMTQSMRTLAISSLFIPALFLQTNVIAADSLANKTETQANSISSVSDSKANLMNKLNKFAYFSADFTQKILTDNGDLLQEGAGNLAISKPNLVNWKTKSPDETLIVSDGDTLWFYDPFIEQASAYSLAHAINNTPILLLTSDDPTLWQQYDVTENGLRFEVLPKSADSQIKKLTLRFVETSSKTLEIAEFSFKDATGQISQINLTNFSNKIKPKDALFKFTLPEGVRLEDKR